MNAVAKLFVPLLKQTIKIFLVLVFKENILPGIPPEENMVYSPRVEKAWFPCHEGIIINLLKLSSLTPDTRTQESIILKKSYFSLPTHTGGPEDAFPGCQVDANVAGIQARSCDGCIGGFDRAPLPHHFGIKRTWMCDSCAGSIITFWSGQFSQWSTPGTSSIPSSNLPHMRGCHIQSANPM